MPMIHREKILTMIDTLSREHLHGKEQGVRLAAITLLSGGHLLLEDLPGVGKTTLALALAGVLGLSFGRVQCTSDLLPSDITGLSIYDRQANLFHFVKGPIFNNIVLVDEINRTMPKTQSALLEAMEEGRVTVEGVTYTLPSPFLVIATQNPLEQVGTYPLPESQMDRFLIRTGIGYPSEELEKKIILQGGIRENLVNMRSLLSGDDIAAAREEMHSRVELGQKVIAYLYGVVARTRAHPDLLAGISTRGAISLAEAARASAYLEGRAYVSPEDVRDMAVFVGSHRLLLRGENAALSKEELLREILRTLPIPLV